VNSTILVIGGRKCVNSHKTATIYDGEKQWFEFTQHKAIQVISKKGGQDVNV